MNQTKQTIAGLFFLSLLVSLIFRLTTIPGGLILSGLFLGLLKIGFILLISAVLAWIIKKFAKGNSFLTFFFSISSIGLAIFYYQLYSPTLELIVPEGYTGEINLIKSNEPENILTIDTNGIGYLNKWTFNKVFTQPIVVDTNGKNLEEQLVGFNPSTFYGSGKSTFSDNGLEIESLSFEIVPINKIGEKQYYHTDLQKAVDLNKVK